MEEVLAEGTLKGLSSLQELNNSLTASAQTQRLLAHNVGPTLSCCAPAGFNAPQSPSSLRWRP